MNAFVKRGVCQVMLWVKEHGSSAEDFWDFLRDYGTVTMAGFSYDDGDAAYRVAGGVYCRGVNEAAKTMLLDELQTLMVCGFDANGDATSITPECEQEDLRGWINAEKVFKQNSDMQEEDASLDLLLRQLKGLYA